MKRNIQFLACLALATCCFGQVDFVRADEREELKARLAEIETEAKRIAEQGKPDEIVRLNRERSELMRNLIRLQWESQQKGQGEGQGRGVEKRDPYDMPPELMEKMERAKQQINHLRIASEHLKMAQKHDMAHELMRQAEEIERDVHQAIAQQKSHHWEKVQLDRQRAERDRLRAEHMEKQRNEEMAERERQAEQRKESVKRENSKEQQVPERAFVRPKIEPPMPPLKGREEAMQGLQKEIKQLREENREIRQMMERISQELKRMQSRD
jgi:colicin import membrane protein